jgi:hypothetical protein
VAPEYDPDDREGFDPIYEELGPNSKIWNFYLPAAKEFDEKMVNAWNKSIDVLLVFVRLLHSQVEILHCD